MPPAVRPPVGTSATEGGQAPEVGVGANAAQHGDQEDMDLEDAAFEFDEEQLRSLEAMGFQPGTPKDAASGEAASQQHVQSAKEFVKEKRRQLQILTRMCKKKVVKPTKS